MYVIRRHNGLDDLHTHLSAGLADGLAQPFAHSAVEHFVAVLGYPDDVKSMVEFGGSKNSESIFFTISCAKFYAASCTFVGTNPISIRSTWKRKRGSIWGCSAFQDLDGREDLGLPLFCMRMAV